MVLLAESALVDADSLKTSELVRQIRVADESGKLVWQIRVHPALSTGLTINTA